MPLPRNSVGRASADGFRFAVTFFISMPCGGERYPSPADARQKLYKLRAGDIYAPSLAFGTATEQSSIAKREEGIFCSTNRTLFATLFDGRASNFFVSIHLYETRSKGFR